jgi:AraC-like DNA-binding protein
MTLPPPPLPESSFAAFLFHMDSFHTFLLQPDGLGELISQEYTLLIFRTDAIRIYMNGTNKLIHALGTFLLTPGDSCQFENIEGKEISYQLIRFRAFELKSAQPVRYTGALFPERNELIVSPLAAWSDSLQALAAACAEQTSTGALQQQICFQQLLAFLLRHNGQEQDDSQSLRQTITYMEQHFREPLSVKQLAGMVDIPPWKYTTLFRELTGSKPLDYLTDLRIAHAKEMLSDPGVPLREIARLSGFTDEYYFNRRFRALTGMTPRQFSKATAQHITLTDWTGHQVQAPKQPKNIVYLGECVEDLQVLGIVPGGYKDLSSTNARNLAEEAAALQPDLMILTQSNERLYSQIAEIGPTLTHNTHDSLENRLITLGEWLDRRKEAASWINGYKTAVEGMWSKLRLAVRPGETASVITIERGEKLFVMGALGLSAFLFHPAGFQPAGRTAEIVQTGRPYREITTNALQHYTGDRIFVVRSRDEQSSKALDRMLSSELWQRLPAVERGCCYVLEESWNDGSALAQQRLVRLLPKLLYGSALPCQLSN